ncbi:MAG: glutamyl-tRNA reductase [Pseudomonadales bacterium]
MALLVIGISFRTADVSLREKFAFPETDTAPVLKELTSSVQGLNEAIILSTCNRTEIYCSIEKAAHENLVQWFLRNRHGDPNEFNSINYTYWDLEAARHMMRVTSGLDSQVLGEPQIAGQVKDAYDSSRRAETLGPELNVLARHSFRAAKKVRSHTDIGRNPVSVASAAVTTAHQIFSDLSTTSVLLVGAGATIELVARHLKSAGVHRIAIANRSLKKATSLATKVAHDSMHLSEIGDVLHEYDIIISSTGSPERVIAKKTVQQACRKRRYRPLFMVDIAVPRDIDPEVATLKDVYLYTIDDLTSVIEENIVGRKESAEQAEEIILETVEQYAREKGARNGQELIKLFRKSAGNVRDAELKRAINRLDSGGDPGELLSRLAHDLTNKLIHSPTLAIRNAASDDRKEILEYIRKSLQRD